MFTYPLSVSTPRAALCASAKPQSDAFYAAKVHTARFYFKRLLPRTLGHVAAIKSGAANLLDMETEQF